MVLYKIYTYEEDEVHDKHEVLGAEAERVEFPTGLHLAGLVTIRVRDLKNTKGKFTVISCYDG